MRHELVNNTLTVEDDGIKAECTCGWITRGRFSSMIASLAFEEHQDEAAKREETTCSSPPTN